MTKDSLSDCGPEQYSNSERRPAKGGRAILRKAKESNKQLFPQYTEHLPYDNSKLFTKDQQSQCHHEILQF